MLYRFLLIMIIFYSLRLLNLTLYNVVIHRLKIFFSDL